ncbi:MAG: hypothetical protein LBK61_14145 [Spirochaetaceae bacterium]|jgi:hypothetical protein|nr:hypothetical protein [Spirochaetaceae bacterium]
MEKKFFTGMAVLLIASLFFLGCPTDNGTAAEPETPAKSEAESLVDDLGGASKAKADGAAITLTDNVELAKAVTVPKDVTLTVGAGKTLTVPEGQTLTVTGILNGTDTASKLVLGKDVKVTVATVELTEGTYVWKFYSAVPANDTFGVLLFSGAADKTVTLDIDLYANGANAAKTGDHQTVVIDYTDVDFTNAVDTTPVTP